MKLTRLRIAGFKTFVDPVDFLIEPGLTEGKTFFETQMGENVVASPAFQDGRIYVRTKSQLICIGKKWG